MFNKPPLTSFPNRRGRRCGRACVVVPGRFVAFHFAGGRDAPPPGGAESEPVGMEAADGPHLDPAELEGMFRAWGVGAVVSLGERRSVAPPPLSLTVSCRPML